MRFALRTQRTVTVAVERMRWLATAPAPPDDAPHLLLVDDDRRIRDLLPRFLGGRRLSRHHGRERGGGARQARPACIFDLLILDVMMPGENRLRSRPLDPQLVGRADPDADRAP